MAIVVVQAKSMQKLYFLISKPILKQYFYPNTSYAKKFGQIGP